MTDKERYATIGTWVEVFREEGVNISEPTIRSYLREAGSIGKTARNKVGHIVAGGFYSESLVRGLLTNLIQKFPQPDENGFFEKDGETYATINTLCRLFDISERAIKSSIRRESLEPIRAKNKIGRVSNFYSISAVKGLCGNDAQDIIQAEKNGLVEKDGQIYGTIESLARFFHISTPTITQRVRKSSLKAVQGKNIIGRVFDYYSASEVRQLCADLVQDLPQANEDGTFKIDDQTYGTKFSLSKLLGLSQRAIRSIIRNSVLKPICGKDKGGKIHDFYLLVEVQKLCADLIAKKSQRNGGNS